MMKPSSTAMFLRMLPIRAQMPVSWSITVVTRPLLNSIRISSTSIWSPSVSAAVRVASAASARCSVSASRRLADWCDHQEHAPNPAAPVMKGRNGRPGTKASRSSRIATTPSAPGWPPSCAIKALSALPRTPPFAISRAAATEMMTAGICETRPSPTVRMA